MIETNNFVLVAFLSLVLLPALAPPASAWHEHCGGSVTSGGDVFVWVPGVHGSRCAGAWIEQDPSTICPVGVGEIRHTPLFLRGARGAGCPVGAAILIP